MIAADRDLQSPNSIGDKLPPELQASVDRHSRHLAALISSLRAAGFGDDLIDASVRDLIGSYQDELAAAIRTLGEGRDHA